MNNEVLTTISDAAKKHNVEIRECAGNIIIAKTMYGQWKFDATNLPYELFHRPVLMWDYKESLKKNDGYHRQNKKFTDINDLFDYICAHDASLMKRIGKKINIRTPKRITRKNGT